MKFGLCYIPDYHAEQSGSWQDWYEGMIAEVKFAESLGFHSAWFAEHRVAGFAFGSPAMFIAACARETKTIRLGCSVSLLPLNNPVRTAEDFAMADVLSGGRLDFGVGRGLYKYDYDVANVDMAESRDRFDENLAIVHAALGRCDPHQGNLSLGRRQRFQPADRAVLYPRLPGAITLLDIHAGAARANGHDPATRPSRKRPTSPANASAIP